MLINKAINIFQVQPSDIVDVQQSKNLQVTELKLKENLSLKVDEVTRKAKMYSNGKKILTVTI